LVRVEREWTLFGRFLPTVRQGPVQPEVSENPVGNVQAEKLMGRNVVGLLCDTTRVWRHGVEQKFDENRRGVPGSG